MMRTLNMTEDQVREGKRKGAKKMRGGAGAARCTRDPPPPPSRTPSPPAESQAITAITVAVDFGISQVVDGNWGIHAIVPKKVFLAPGDTYSGGSMKEGDIITTDPSMNSGPTEAPTGAPSEAPSEAPAEAPAASAPAPAPASGAAAGVPMMVLVALVALGAALA